MNIQIHGSQNNCCSMYVDQGSHWVLLMNTLQLVTKPYNTCRFSCFRMCTKFLQYHDQGFIQRGGVSRDSPSSDDQSKWPRGSPRAEYSSTLHCSTCVWCG